MHAMRLSVLMAWGVIAIPFFVGAMPSAAELDAVAPVVQKLMQPEQEYTKYLMASVPKIGKPLA